MLELFIIAALLGSSDKPSPPIGAVCGIVESTSFWKIYDGCYRSRLVIRRSIEKQDLYPLFVYGAWFRGDFVCASIDSYKKFDGEQPAFAKHNTEEIMALRAAHKKMAAKEMRGRCATCGESFSGTGTDCGRH